MGVSLDRLLESSHLLDFDKLAAPLLLYCVSLITLNFELLIQTTLYLLQMLNLFLELLDLLVRLLALLTLKSINCLEQAVGILDLVFNQRPQLLE
jgi:hypothetical protein